MVNQQQVTQEQKVNEPSPLLAMAMQEVLGTGQQQQPQQAAPQQRLEGLMKGLQ